MLFIVIIINTENQLNQLNEAINYKRLKHQKETDNRALLVYTQKEFFRSLEDGLYLFNAKGGVEEHFILLRVVNTTTRNEENIHITPLSGGYPITPTLPLLPYQFPLKSLRQQQHLLFQLHVIESLIFYK